MDTLGLAKIHLVGYSMGGRAALYFAVHHPERVASLTLESTSPGLTDPHERRTRAEEDARRAETILSGGIAPFVEHWYTLPLFRSLENHPAVRAEIMARRKTNHPAWVASVIRDLSPGRQPAVWDQLSRLKMPILLIVGALDEKYVTVGQRMAALLPHARLEIVPDAGHTVHLEQPARFISLLRGFLALVK
jgi:2-succinyl-6-hydroxy-2,4-cyclohexadiene-1-carboxylate synthase